MWIPTQLLHDDKVTALRQGGFSDIQIEFLGWLSYCASAINNSRNPVKAAHSLLAKENADKMFTVFCDKKKESVRPKYAEHDALSQKFRDLESWLQAVDRDVVLSRAAHEPED